MLHIITIIIVLLGALNTSANLFDMNFVKELGNYTNKNVSTIIYVLIGLSVIYILFDRNTYLPFLGQSVFPCHALTEKVPVGANTKVTVKTTPNTKIVYWAANSGNNTDVNYKEAYNTYENSGVTISDNLGVAVMRVRRPSGYNVRLSKLDPHVHYRQFINMNMLDEVKTVFLPNK